MLQVQSYSYLDLSVHPELRPYVLAEDAAVLFNSQLDSILWSNFAGAKLFGGDGIVELLEAKLGENQNFIRQLRDAVHQIEEEQPLIRGFRVSIGHRSTLMQFEISPIRFADGNLCFKVTQKGQTQGIATNEHERANQAVESLEGFADAAAIVDDFGLFIAATDGFEELGPDETSLADLILELKAEDDRLIKRQIISSDGNPVVAGFGRISNQPPRSLIVLAQVSEEKADITDSEKESQIERTANEDDPDSNSDNFNSPKQAEVNADPEPYARDPAAFSDLRHETDNQPIIASAGDALKGNSKSADLNIGGAEQSRPKEAIKDDEQVRFAWSTDLEGNFKEVSQELKKSVGAPAADIIGRNWREVSTVFGFDNDGEIASLLAKHDTWSGKSVLWPVSGTDMVVPIDLAALPVFDSERRFAGFRGFGIIRTLDTIVDPEETGLALEDNGPKATDTSIDEVSATEETSNIIPMNSDVAEARSNDDQLTTSESDAFEKIGARLKSEFGQPTNDLSNEENEFSRKPDTSLIEKLPIAIMVYRQDTVLFANQRFLDATGYSELEELEAAGGLEAVLNTGQSAELASTADYSLQRKGGEPLQVDPVLHKVPWDGENAMQLSFTVPTYAKADVPAALDITQASEIQSVLDVTSDGIILLENDGEIISINASAEALFNRSFDDAVGKHLTSLFTEEGRGEINQYINGLSNPGIEGLLQEGREVIAAESSGGMIPVLLTIAPLKSSEKLCAVIRDLTSWKQTEQELIKSRRDAERSSEQKTDFLAQVSHEVRIPLTAIIGFSDIMIGERFGPINNERYREYLRDIKRSGQHVLDLVNDLLDLSKIEAGKLDLNFEAVNLNDIVTEAVAMLQPHANTNRIIIRTSLSRSVPKVVADLRSIRQIILNLVTNAIKFSPTNSQVIVSSVYENSGEVALRIRDTGTGMTEVEIEEAMKPYNQLNNIAERSSEGTGLGLPLTKALIEANRAYFDLESKPGEGTIAHVQFPIQRVLAD